MDVADALLNRRTVHDYLDEPIPEGALDRALGAATCAPNHHMTEPWRFLRVGKHARETLVDISLSLKAEKTHGSLDESTKAKVKSKMMNPAELLVVSQRICDAPAVGKEDYAAITCAVQNLSLSLWSEGVGSKWSTGAVSTDNRTYMHLGIGRETEEIVGFVYVGMPAKVPPAPRRKRSLEELLREVP